MVVHKPPPLIELAHLDTVPVGPLSVIEPLFVPVHTELLPAVVPPAICVTVIVALDELAVAQTPF